MIIRIAMGIGDSSVELWEIILSLFLLVFTFMVTTWFSSKVYNKGVLSYGKKISYSVTNNIDSTICFGDALHFKSI